VGDLIGEGIVVHCALPEIKRSGAGGRAGRRCGLDSDSLDRYPHEYFWRQPSSGVAIAPRARRWKPSVSFFLFFVFFYVWTACLGACVACRRRYWCFCKNFQAAFGLTYLLIAHDLAG